MLPDFVLKVWRIYAHYEAYQVVRALDTFSIDVRYSTNQIYCFAAAPHFVSAAPESR